jgi:hypothetical protein
VYLQYCWHENKHNSNTERVWRIWASNKCRFFIWLVEHNRCWTSDKLAKRGMDHPERCPLCDQQDETINHLLASCVFARQVWTGLLQPAGLLELTLQPHDGVFEDWCTQVCGFRASSGRASIHLWCWERVLFGSTGIAACSMACPLVCRLFLKWPERRRCSGLWPELKGSPCFRP